MFYWIYRMYYFLPALFICSWILTCFVRRYALIRNIIDHPNHRSSHTLPTPRGGGLAFVGTFLIALLLMIFWGELTIRVGFIWVAMGLSLAVLGFIDDNGSISAGWRLIGHFMACSVTVFGLGGMPLIHVFSWILPAHWCMDAVAVVYLVWLLNLYNFMDGIDGLAGIEAVSVCISASIIYALVGTPDLMTLPLLLAASVAGFLCWNFPCARIFMGDVGSGFLGFTLGALSLEAARVDDAYFWSWLILLGVFIVDSTYTLLFRFYSGARVSEAHRSHAYQHAAVVFGNHLPVTLGVLGVNVCWLFPLALVVGLGYVNGVIGVCVAYLPLVVLVVKFKAGKAL